MKRFTVLGAALMLLAFLTIPLGMKGQTSVTWPGTTALPGSATAVANDQNITIMVSSTNTYTNPIRIYANTTVTIDALNGAKILSVNYEASSTGNYVTNAQNATVTPETTPTVSGKNVVWTYATSDNVTTFTFKPSAQTRCNGITITYTTGSTNVVATPVITPNGGSFLDSQEVSIACATEGATIYYTTNGNDPTTSSTQYTAPFTLNATTTVKAFAVKANYDNSAIVTATFTKATAMTVAEARDYIDELNGATSSDDVFVEGVISQIDSYNSNYHSITYWISDDGTTADQMEVYSGKGLNGADFAAVTDLTLGSTVIVKGKVKLYNTTYEFIQNSQIVSLTLPSTPYITAEDVELAYDDTQSAIEYTIVNAVSGGVLTAATTSNWLTVGTVGTNIPVSCEPNTTASARTATVILTYAYDNQTVTKEVTVTQAGDPNIVDNISDITAVGTAYTVRGTVVAINNKGFVMGDGTGYC